MGVCNGVTREQIVWARFAMEMEQFRAVLGALNSTQVALLLLLLKCFARFKKKDPIL